MDFTEYRKRMLKEYDKNEGAKPPSDEYLLMMYLSLVVMCKYERDLAKASIRKVRTNAQQREQ